MLEVNKTFQFLDFPVQDFGNFGSVKYREVITDIQQETYRRADPSAFSIISIGFYCYISDYLIHTACLIVSFILLVSFCLFPFVIFRFITFIFLLVSVVSTRILKVIDVLFRSAPVFSL